MEALELGEGYLGYFLRWLIGWRVDGRLGWQEEI